MSKFKNRIGHKYGALTVIKFAGFNPRNQADWLCRCDCGKEKIVFSGNLNNGHTTSCGCLKGLWKHGENQNSHRTVEYNTWASMIQRCENKNSVEYHNYGGRGISVCDKWRSSFSSFLADVGRRPSKKHSLDRWPDKNGNYEPGNVRWATAIEQGSNSRKNKTITIGGETMHLAEAARRFGIAPAKISYRLRHGWSVEETIKTP